MMHASRIRLLAVAGATLALVLAGTSIAGAHPGRDDDRGARYGPSMGRSSRDLREGDRRPGPRRLEKLPEGFVRHETTYESEEGVVVRRVDDGTVSAASETGLEYSIATGEAVSVTADDETRVIGFTQETVERRGWTRERWVPQEIALADISAGSAVMVWSTSQDDGTFVAQRIVVTPDIEERAEEEPPGGAPADEAPADGAAEGATDVTPDASAGPIANA